MIAHERSAWTATSVERQMSQEERLLLTIPEAARALGISVSQGYVLAHTGVLPIVRIGRSVRVSRRTLAAWCEELESDRPAAGRSR